MSADLAQRKEAAREQSRDETNRALSHECIAQLLRSERGRGALSALAVFLNHGDTYGLDYLNQAAIERLLNYALYTPSVRGLIDDAVSK